MDGEAILGIIVIIVSLIVSMNKGKKIKQNAPGQTGAPDQSGNNRPMNLPQEPFWKQVIDSYPSVRPAIGQQKDRPTVAALEEGASRKCEHGTLGGSISYEKHERELHELQAFEKQIPAAQGEAAFMRRTVRNAEEVRKAVIVAEILKRPQERMAEQSRRWNAR